MNWLNLIFSKMFRKKKTYRGDDIHDEILVCFESSIPILSVGRRMLYPTSFNVLLHPHDFEEINETLPFLVQEVSGRMEEIIGKYKKKNHYTNFEAPSRNWFFQFSACEKFSPSGNPEDTITIERYSPYIIGALYSTAIGGNNVREAGNLKMSLKPKNSETYAKYDINPNVFLGIDTLGTGIFKIKIKSDLQPSVENTVTGSNEIYAKIHFDSLVFEMIDKEIIISRKTAQHHLKSNILMIDAPHVKESHARIRYDPSAKKFAIAAFYFIRVNEAEIPVSSARNPIWFDLPSVANILVGDQHSLPTALSFNAGK
jgi:hypothetical protein